MKKRHLRLLAALAGTALIVSGCASAQPSTTPSPEASEVDTEWQAVIDAAKEEGTVVWYSIAPQAVRDAVKAGFEAKYPEITVEISTVTSAEMNAALEAEHDTGVDGADVVTSVAYSWIAEKQADGWFVDLDDVPSLQAPEWTASGYFDGTTVSSPLGLLVIGWNTDLYQGELATYDDLLDPSLAGGAIGTVRPEPAIHADHWAYVQEYFDEDWLEDFSAQKPSIYPSAFANQEALAAGEIAVSDFVSATDIMALQEQGAPVEFVVPDPVWAAQNVFFVPESSKRQNAAKLFMDYFASDEGQRAAAEFGYSPLKSVAPDTLGGQSEVVLTNIDHMLDPQWSIDYLAEWTTYFG
ncbi:ABC transporter substrate-binding protein [Microbacterium sp.]|uniref:ABC transporter substrate-binding protein n=1 Tax=Microbacterium sp. TaxID=51671 RepID=UPI002CDBF5ED|nr:extracellular solute-binding protein [Microbacterium sp.]HWL79148.1 extracellular solute-binding protein [Microbacterium sp.]